MLELFASHFDKFYMFYAVVKQIRNLWTIFEQQRHRAHVQSAENLRS